jgi:hypothetical protein
MPSGLPLFDAVASRAARDAGISAAADNAFMADARDILVRSRADLPPLFLSEDLRLLVSARGCVPQSAHAWGALTRWLIATGVIEATGRWLPMRDVRSHARKSPEYRWTHEPEGKHER